MRDRGCMSCMPFTDAGYFLSHRRQGRPGLKDEEKAIYAEAMISHPPDWHISLTMR